MGRLRKKSREDHRKKKEKDVMEGSGGHENGKEPTISCGLIRNGLFRKGKKNARTTCSEKKGGTRLSGKGARGEEGPRELKGKKK